MARRGHNGATSASPPPAISLESSAHSKTWGPPLLNDHSTVFISSSGCTGPTFSPAQHVSKRARYGADTAPPAIGSWVPSVVPAPAAEKAEPFTNTPITTSPTMYATDIPQPAPVGMRPPEQVTLLHVAPVALETSHSSGQNQVSLVPITSVAQWHTPIWVTESAEAVPQQVMLPQFSTPGTAARLAPADAGLLTEGNTRRIAAPSRIPQNNHARGLSRPPIVSRGKICRNKPKIDPLNATAFDLSHRDAKSLNFNKLRPGVRVLFQCNRRSKHHDVTAQAGLENRVGVIVATPDWPSTWITVRPTGSSHNVKVRSSSIEVLNDVELACEGTQ